MTRPSLRLCLPAAVMVLLAVATQSTVALAAFPGANGKIVFESDRDGVDSEIYVMSSDGSNQTRLTNNTAVDIGPRWSPDGTKILFSSNRDGNFEIYVMNADGTGQTRLTFTLANETGAQWSPDGAQIAFAYDDMGPNQLYVMNADGSGRTNLTSGANDLVPDWSPDGTKIAFARIDGGTTDIYVVNADGSGLTRLTNEGANNPSWSPDGTKIVFASDRESTPGAPEIYVMYADGTGVTRLTFTSVYNDAPRWSPDGTKIVFQRDPEANSQFEVFRMSADGTGQVNISNTPGRDATADWQPISAVAQVTSLSPAHVWIGLKNSDDQGTQFDIMVELLQNGTPVASGLERCVTGVVRNAASAKEAVVTWDAFSAVPLSSGDVVSLRVSTRIGTTSTGARCLAPSSHTNAAGLRLYYDSTGRPSRFDATIEPEANQDLYLHSDGTACGSGQSTGVTTRTLDSTAPTAASAKCKDSGSLNFAGGNPFSVIGTWSLPPLP